MWTGGEESKTRFFVDVINGWPLTRLLRSFLLLVEVWEGKVEETAWFCSDNQ